VDEQHTFAVMDADIARHAVPEPSDGELYLLKVPRFLSFEPAAFSHKTFQPPSTDHHSKVAASEHFSAYNTAMSTIRWRRAPSNSAELQSNARILRWSDGSFTLQIADQSQDSHAHLNQGRREVKLQARELHIPRCALRRGQSDARHEQAHHRP
jgi:hypothetical protein